MSKVRRALPLQDLQALFDRGAAGEGTDRQLLRAFAARGCGSEDAFAALVRRHGTMVLGTCRAALRDHHAAEDAFQATFLVLAQQAGRLWVRDSVGPWLHAVALRIAVHARRDAVRRQRHEQAAATAAPASRVAPNRAEYESVLHEEIDRLPDRFRAVIVLCDLEGLTQQGAAQALGWPAGTVRSRLARGRRRLKDRLMRRGVGLAVAASTCHAAVSPSLAVAVVHTATDLSRAGTPAGVVLIAERVGRVMAMKRAGQLAAASVALVALAAGSAVLIGSARGFQERPPAKAEVRNGAANETPKVAAAPAVPDERIRLLRQIRDSMFRRFQGGEIDLNSYMMWQQRFSDAILRRAKTPRERVQVGEAELKGMQTLEAIVNRLYENEQATLTDGMIINLYRLEAEERLEEAKQELANSEPQNAPAEHPRKKPGSP